MRRQRSAPISLALTLGCALWAAAGAAAAEPILGTWLSPPDARGQVGHVVFAPCGGGFCGTLVRAFSPEGQPVTTANVGKTLVWDMRAAGSGAYGGGKVYVPALDTVAEAQLSVQGDSLTVEGCKAGICRSQVWQRVD